MWWLHCYSVGSFVEPNALALLSAYILWFKLLLSPMLLCISNICQGIKFWFCFVITVFEPSIRQRLVNIIVNSTRTANKLYLTTTGSWKLMTCRCVSNVSPTTSKICVSNVKHQILTYFVMFLSSFKFYGFIWQVVATHTKQSLYLSFWDMAMFLKPRVPSMWPWPLNCFGALTMTPYVSMTLILTFTNVVNGAISNSDTELKLSLSLSVCQSVSLSPLPATQTMVGPWYILFSPLSPPHRPW